MRSQEEEAVFQQWLNEDVAHENAMIEQAMREQSEADIAMEEARNEAMYDHHIQEVLTANCKASDGTCHASEYYCKPDGSWSCKKCSAVADI